MISALEQTRLNMHFSATSSAHLKVTTRLSPLAGWGAKVIERLAADLHREFPGMTGFSRTNLLYMRAFAEAWPKESFVQQVVGQIPWG